LVLRMNGNHVAPRHGRVRMRPLADGGLSGSAEAASAATRAGLPARWSAASQKSRSGPAEVGSAAYGSSMISEKSTVWRPASGCRVLTATKRGSVARTSKSSSAVAEGRLGQVQVFGGAGEVQLAGDRREVPQVAQVSVHSQQL
jgi:hypothetical protein